ncbi:right-handed parallel beta-helix repeat-containing protein [bacterium]|nr:right-handed parallel beta-helix repeat-containing protein [bacterium]
MKSTSVLTLAILLFAAAAVLADTSVQGEVYGIWTIENSPYVVEDDLFVPAGYSLTIEPGVEVKFHRYAVPDPFELAVYGTLYATGEPGNHIIFTSYATTPQPDHWDGIKFLTEEAGQSQVSYCEIYYANWGISIQNSSPAITHNIIASGFSDGIRIYGYSDAVVQYNLIRNYTYRGIKIEDTASPTVTNNTIVNNNSFGIYAYNYTTPTLINNIVWGNNNYGIRIAGYSVPVMDYNNVYNNTPQNYSGISPGPNSISANPLFVNPSIGDFTLQSASPCIDAGDPSFPYDPDGTRADMGAYYYNQPPAVPVFTSQPDTIGLTLLEWSYDVNAAGVPAPEYSLMTAPAGMQIDASSGLITWTPDESNIGGNTVIVQASNNQGADEQQFTLYIELNLPPVISSYSPTSLDTIDYVSEINFSVIAEELNNQALSFSWYLDDQQLDYDSSEIDILFNFVGEHSVKAVASDGLLADSVIWDVFIPGIILNGGITGTISTSGNPYYMNGDINIPEGGECIIEPGVIIKIHRPSPATPLGIDVHGTLLAEGTLEYPIIFTPLPSGPAMDHWQGITFHPNSNPASILDYCHIDHANTAVEIMECAPEISNCLITYCYSYGVYISNSGGPDIHHNTFWQNNGKPVYCIGAHPTVYNNTMVSNTSSAVYISSVNAASKFFNNICAYNGGYGIRVNTAANVIVKYNDCYQNALGNYYGIGMGEGGLSIDPLFDNYTAGQFELTVNSPCIDAGDPYSPFDPDGTFADMGRYYFQQPASPPLFLNEPDTLNIAGFLYEYVPSLQGVPWPQFNLDSAPAGMTLDTLFGVVNYLADPGVTGIYTIDLSAENILTNVHQIWTLNVILNSPPVITAYWPGIIDTVDYKQQLNFGINAEDPNNHEITCSWLHNGNTVSGDTMMMNLTCQAFGENIVSVIVTDGVDSTQQDWEFFVKGTEVSGYISGIWSESNSPYVAIDNITVDNNDTLIIDPGVTILFDGPYALTNSGYLEINGTQEAMVCMASNSDNPQPDDWDGLNFESASDDNSIVKYCDIRHGHNGIKLFYCSPTIKNCVLSYSGNAGVKLENSAAELVNNTSAYNLISGFNCYMSNPVINNCIAAYNNSYGITATNSSPVLSYNDVYGNGVAGHNGCSAGPGSLAVNPQLVSSTNFHLKSISPCIDVGDPSRPYDPDGTRSDMGALYFPQFPVVNNLTISISGNHVYLNWGGIPDASIYHIYRGNDPYMDVSDMSLLGHSNDTDFTDADALLEGDSFFYIVTWE